MQATDSNLKRKALVTTLALSLAAVAVALLVVRWAVAPPRAVTLNLGTPDLATSHFYPVEPSDAISFRWSRTASAISLPALATSQVISVTLNPARPPELPPAHFRLSIGTQDLGSYEAQPGWNTYTATVGPGLGPDIRLVIDSETFFPGPGDRRKLGMAVAEVATAPREGRAGLRLPPYLWLIAAALIPFCATILGTRRSLYYGAIAGVGTALLPTIASQFLPATLSLPVMSWLAALLAAAMVLFWAGRRTLDDRIAKHEAQDATSIENLQSAIRNPHWKELGLVALFTGALAVVFTWPLATRISSSMPGWPADNFAFLYKLWWFRTALIERGQWPLFDPNSYAPFGFDLGQGEPTLVNTLPGVLFGSLTNDVTSYNLLILLSFVISGVGAYLLVRELTGNINAALLASVVFAFCPYRMAQIAGHLQLAGTGWIALSFYFLERTLKTRSIKDGALLGLMLSLTALSAWYYAYMVGLGLVLYTIVRLWQTANDAAKRTPTIVHRLSSLVRPYLKPLAAGVVVFLLLGGIAAIPSLRLWAQGGLTHSAKAADEHSAAPLDYVIPNQLQPVWGEPFMRAHANQNIIESNLYLGLVAVIIMIAGWVVRRRARLPALRAAAAWLTLLIVAGVLSLGLTLHDTNGQAQFQFGPLPLPGQLLFDWLPFYSSMRAYARFGVLVALAVAVLVGVAWTYILQTRPHASTGKFAPNQLTLFAILFVLVDLWTSPYSWGTSRVEPSETARFLSAQPQAGLVMQMPLTASQSGPLLFQETYYGPGKPIAYGYDTFEPEPWREARPALENFPDDAALDVLAEWGVRYIVVSANAYGADWPGTLEYLQSLPRLSYMETVQETRTWEVDPAVLDAQPDFLQYFEPDTQAIFELVVGSR